MSAEVEISIEGRAGIVTLTREKAINALSHGMITSIASALEAFERDPAIALVVFEGRGEKGFCAGGDVRAARDAVLGGNAKAAMAYFSDEYRMNETIATYAKPIVALQHGYVMGGGIGLSSHARYRISAASGRFAMPEAAIGFFSDVGVNAILYQTADHRALAFLMSGMAVEPGDAVALGLSDAVVATDRMGVVRERVIAAASAADPDTALAAVIAWEAIDAGPTQFCAAADLLRFAFEGQAPVDIVANLSSLVSDGDPAASALHQAMSRHCPTSLEVIVHSHRLARRLRDVSAILALDADLAGYMAQRPDFAEGVRAVLVDKDRAPRWSPGSLADVDRVALARILAAYGDESAAI